MGLNYRKRKGAFTFSASGRGPGLSVRFGKGGCLLPALILITLVVALVLAA